VLKNLLFEVSTLHMGPNFSPVMHTEVNVNYQLLY
jgi:hypothetical protein